MNGTQLKAGSSGNGHLSGGYGGTAKYFTCQKHRKQEGRALWRTEPPHDATFAHTPIVFCTKFGDVPPRVRSMSSVVR